MIGLHQAGGRGPQADEALRTENGSAGQVHQGLAMQHQSVVAQGLFQVLADVHIPLHAEIGRQAVSGDPVPTAALHVVHREIGSPHQLFGIQARVGAWFSAAAERHPHAHREVEIKPPVLPRFGKTAAQPLGPAQGFVPVGEVIDQHHELITPQPGDGVLLPQHSPQPPSNLLQQAVPHRMAIAVVHLLETVEIAEDQGNAMGLAGQGALQLLHQAAAIGQAGERVAPRLFQEHQLTGLAVRDVPLDRNPMGVCPLCVGQGGNLELDSDRPPFA